MINNLQHKVGGDSMEKHLIGLDDRKVDLQWAHGQTLPLSVKGGRSAKTYSQRKS